MIPWRNRRLVVILALIAIPMEALAFHLLAYAPRIGMPRDPARGLQLSGSLAAVFHAPILLLNDFICRGVHVPGFILCADTVVFGYTLSILILRLFCWMTFGR